MFLWARKLQGVIEGSLILVRILKICLFKVPVLLLNLASPARYKNTEVQRYW